MNTLGGCKNYLPDGKDIYDLPRQYLLDMFISIEGGSAEAWVDKLCQDHYKK